MLNNLDGLSEQELAEHESVFHRLQEYCHDKRIAMEARKRGAIQQAQEYENWAEINYKNLPDWAKW